MLTRCENANTIHGQSSNPLEHLEYLVYVEYVGYVKLKIDDYDTT